VKKINRLVWIFCLSPLASCIGLITTDKSTGDRYLIERNNSLELLTVLTLLTENNGVNVAEDNIHIRWQTGWTSGITRKNEPYDDFAYGRIGTFHITMDSTFSGFFMRQRQHPVPWSVHMYGGRNIYLQCVLKTDTTGGNEFTSVIDYLKKKKLLIESTCYDLKDNSAQWLFPEYRRCTIKLPNKKIIHILVMTFGMNGSTDQAIYFNSDGSDTIQFPEEFKSDYRPDKTHDCN
jgi:hypothetical protein